MYTLFCFFLVQAFCFSRFLTYSLTLNVFTTRMCSVSVSSYTGTTVTLKPRLVYKGLVILFLSSFQNIITILSRCRNFVGYCLAIGSFDVTNNYHLFPCKHSVPNFDITIPFSPNLTLRRLMSYIYIYIYIYIYMEHPFLMFLDHTQRRSTVGRTPLDE